MAKKSVLIIGKTWPEPETTGAGVRMMQIIQLFLNYKYEVSFASAASQAKHSVNLKKYKVKCFQVKINDSHFNDILKTINPQIVIFDRFHTEEQFSWRVDEVLPNALKILDSEDLHFLRKARENLVKKDHYPYNQKEVFNESLKNEETFRELNAMYRCDLTFIISSFELDFLKSLFNFPEKNVLFMPLLPRGANKDSMPFSQRKNFVFVGNFNHQPNVDAVKILNKVYPKIREVCKDSELHIYGTYVPQSILNLHNPKKGFYIKGWVENLSETLEKYRLMLAPLRFGAGIKGKILESLNVNTPIVSTEIGFEGITQGKDIPGYSGPIDDTWIQETIKLYGDTNAWNKSSELANQVIKSIAWNENEIIGKIQQFQECIEEKRRVNIIQSMLSLSNNQTYKYLSKYIEIKNKKVD